MQSQGPHQVLWNLQLQLGVDLDVFCGLCRQGDALVDVHQNVAGSQSQVVQADKPDRRGGCLQAGEAARGVVGVRDQCQTKVQAPQ